MFLHLIVAGNKQRFRRVGFGADPFQQPRVPAAHDRPSVSSFLSHCFRSNVLVVVTMF